MANYNDNDLEELDFGESSKPPEDSEEKKPSNRNFMIALGIIGGIFVLAVIALVVVAVFILPGRQGRLQEENQAQLAANTAAAQLATDQAEADAKAAILLTPSPTVTVVETSQPTPTNTLVLAPQSTRTPTVTNTPVADAQKLTLSAQQTQMAEGKFTATVIATTTALPNTGFADEVGLPGLLGVGLAMIVIIFLARRLRTNPA